MTQQSSNSSSVNGFTRCTHSTRNGRCRMPASDPSSSFCTDHAWLLYKNQASSTLAADLLAGIDDFSSADSVNLFLGNLVTQLAHKRIPRRDAIALGYLSQLLLHSLPILKKEVEAIETAERKAEHARFVARAIQRNEDLAALRNPQPAAAPPTLSPTA